MGPCITKEKESEGPSRIAVLGATGQQGGAVVASLAARGKKVVAITRNAESEKARAVAKLPGVEVRKADLEDVESLKKAFAGCDGAFVLANFWEGMDAVKEMRHYQNAATALKAVGGWRHVVMSTLEETATHPKMQDAPDILQHETGPMKVPHFDGKNRSHKFFDGLPMTYLYTSCYLENFTTFFACTEQEDGSYQFTLPLGAGPIAWTILEDVGNMTAAIFEKPDLIGQTLGSSSLHCSCEQLAQIMSKATGKTITYNCVPWKTFASFGFPGAEELANMFKFFTDTQEEFLAIRDLRRCQQLGGKLMDPIATFRKLPLRFEDPASS